MIPIEICFKDQGRKKDNTRNTKRKQKLLCPGREEKRGKNKVCRQSKCHPFFILVNLSTQSFPTFPCQRQPPNYSKSPPTDKEMSLYIFFFPILATMSFGQPTHRHPPQQHWRIDFKVERVVYFNPR